MNKNKDELIHEFITYDEIERLSDLIAKLEAGLLENLKDEQLRRFKLYKAAVKMKMRFLVEPFAI